MAGALNLFPMRVAIGRAQANGDVLMTPEFMRALGTLFERVGGGFGLSTEDLALELASMSSVAQANALAAPVADLEALAAVPFPTPAPAVQEDVPLVPLPTPAPTGAIEELAAVHARAAQLARTVEALELEIAQLSAHLGTLRQMALESVELGALAAPVAADWEHPGKIGAQTPNSGKFTTLQATGKVVLSPADANVEIKPTGSSLVEIFPAATGRMDNVEIGRDSQAPIKATRFNGVAITPAIVEARLTIGAGKTLTATTTISLGGGDGAAINVAAAKTLTVSNSVGLAGGEGATLNIAGGGTLGSAAFFAHTAFAPAGGGGANWSAGWFAMNGAPPQPTYAVPGAAVDLASVIALSNALRAALVNNGICS